MIVVDDLCGEWPRTIAMMVCRTALIHVTTPPAEDVNLSSTSKNCIATNTHHKNNIVILNSSHCLIAPTANNISNFYNAYVVVTVQFFWKLVKMSAVPPRSG